MGDAEGTLVPGQDLECVALIGGSDAEARAIVERALSAAGLTHYIEGSVVYNVLVHRADADRAREVLASSKALKGRWHQIVKREPRSS